MNDHIINYLKHFCFQIEYPQFSVLLKGDWGSGKSWFVKEFISKNEQEKFLYVSLYGLNDTKEIDDLIFQELHPILSSKAITFTGKLIKSALRLGIKVDVDEAINMEVRPNIPEILERDFTKLSKKILVFDDLERSNLDIKYLLGYINVFVEHQMLNVILVGDEQKLIQMNGKSYLDAKEKIIGQTFVLSPNTGNAVSAFISEIKDEELRSLIQKYESKIKELFQKLNYNNLRDLRQTLLSYEYFYKSINDHFKKEEAFLEKLLLIFCYLSLEQKANMIDKSNWKEAVYLFFNKEMNQKQFNLLQEEAKTKLIGEASISAMFDQYNLPIGNLIYDVVFDGKILSDKINLEIENSFYFRDKNKSTLFQLLNDFRKFSPSEFEGKYKKLIDELKENVYKHPAEILHATGILLLFSEWKLIDKTNDEIITIIKDVIGDLVAKNEIQDHDFYSGYTDNYGGFVFAKNESKEFQDIFNLLKTKNVTIKKIGIKKELDNLIDNFTERYNEFNESLIVIGMNGKYSQFPVLAWIDTQKFFREYLLIPTEAKGHLIYTLKDRYEMKYSNGILREQFYEEDNFLLQLKELIEKKISVEGFLYKPDNFELNRVLIELESIIKYFETNKQTSK